MTGNISEKRLSRLSKLVAERLGLSFPKDRLRYLQQGIDSAAGQLGCKDADSCIERLLLSASWTRAQIEILASYLTIGETYFFRDMPSFEALEELVLKELIEVRGRKGKYLRIWSAGCSTGEEPYSIAILLSKMIPDLSEWDITILATDINPLFIKKAIGGIYSPWSFRSLPDDIKKGFFKSAENGGFRISSRIARMVSFSYLNLVEDNYPSFSNNTNAMDIIFCRNVLMYFLPQVAEKVIRGLHQSLVEGGSLVVSPSESFSLLSSQFSAMRFPAGNLYKKERRESLEYGKTGSKSPLPPFKKGGDDLLLPLESETSLSEGGPSSFTEVGTSFTEVGKSIAHAETSTSADVETSPFAKGAGTSPPFSKGGPGGIFDHLSEPKPHAEIIPAEPDIEASEKNLLEQALASYASGSYAQAQESALGLLAKNPGRAEAMILLARINANRGELEPALEWCRKAIESEKLKAGFYYLLATILQELGRTEAAIPALKRALYLEPDFILAHMALGNIHRKFGRNKEAAKYFRNALSLLNSKNPEEMVPESEGINAGRLIDVIQSMVA